MREFTILVLLLLTLGIPYVGKAQEPPYYVFFVSERDKQVDGEQNRYFSEIYRMNPDGSNQIRLTTNEGYEEFLDAIPQQNKISFTYTEKDDSEIAWMDYDGSGLENLTEDYDNYDSYPEFNKAGTMLFYTSWPRYETTDKQTDSEIFMLDIESRVKKKLTDNSETDYFPTLSPDETEIMFLHRRKQISGDIFSYSYYHYVFTYNIIRDVIHYCELDNLEQGAIYSDKYDYYSIEYSPDGNYIGTIIATSDNVRNAVLLNWEGDKAITQTPDSYGICNGIQFTEDNSKFVFSCHPYGGINDYHFYVMDLRNGYKISKLPVEGFTIVDFDVSPDSKTIFFSALKYGTEEALKEWNKIELFSISIDGSDLKKITENDSADYNVTIAGITTNDSEE